MQCHVVIDILAGPNGKCVKPLVHKFCCIMTVFSLLALQPCVGPGLLHGFLTVNFSVVGWYTPCLTAQPGGPQTTLHLVFTLQPV
jgi:hypothetical protein